LVAYFCHITTYVITLVCIAVIELADIFQSLSKDEGSGRQTTVKYVKLFLAILPSLILTGFFFLNHGGEGIAPNTTSIEEQWHDLFSVRPINVFHLFEEEPISYLIFPTIATLSYLVLIIGLFSVRKTNTAWSVQQNAKKGLLQLRHTFLVMACIFLWLYFNLSSGGFVQIRLLLVFFMMVLAWLATASIPWILGLPVILIILTTNYRLLDYRKVFAEEQNEMVSELVLASEHIPEGSVVLPVIESHHWFFNHVSNYLGTLKPMILLDNYEATTGYFPINWKMKPNPADLLGFSVNNVCGEQAIMLEEKITKVDAVVHYFDGTIDYGTDCDLIIESLLEMDYKLEYTSESNRMKVYLNANYEHDSTYVRKLNFPDENQISRRSVFQTDLEMDTHWGEQGVVDKKGYSGFRSSQINEKNNYGSTLMKPVNEIGGEGKKLLYISFMVWSEEVLPELSMAYSFRRDQSDYAHTYLPCGHLIRKSGQWVKVEELVEMKQAEEPTDEWVVYPYSTSAKNIFIDDIRYEIITLKNDQSSLRTAINAD
jgi:hypothetical protein